MLFEKLTQDSALEQKLKKWTKPASETEDAQCKNAIRMIKDAIKESGVLKDKNFVYVQQGSYHNNTNVKRDSDVDMCIKLLSTFYYQLPSGAKKEDYGIIASSYTYDEYRQSIMDALVAKFGKDAVKPGKKSIKISSNTYRVEADVVPCFEHRIYSEKGVWESGHKYFSSSGESVINFPEQHYTNGNQKNAITGRKYKRIVRILKRLRKELKDTHAKEMSNISSFMIECAVYNVPDHRFNKDSYTAIVRSVLEFLHNSPIDDKDYLQWTEVNGLLPLFNESRNVKQIQDFCWIAYNHLFPTENQ